MKRFTILSLVMASMLALSGMAYAGGGCNGPDCFATGNFNISTGAMGGAIDLDFQTIPNGFAGGISAAGGATGAYAQGFVVDGSAFGQISTTGGGAVNTESYRWNPDVGDRAIGVGSASQGIAQIDGYVAVGVDPAGELLYGFIPTAFGEASGGFAGIAGQGTLDGSILWTSPRYFSNTEGVTYGVAGQGSAGHISGGAFVLSGPDTVEYTRVTVWKKYNYKTREYDYAYGDKPSGHCWRYAGKKTIETPVNSNAEAHAGAGIFMTGGDFSDSYRFVDWDHNSKTEGMGTLVGAETFVTSYGYNESDSDGLAMDMSFQSGGFVASGKAKTGTIQSGPGSFAAANASGSYSGNGTLGCNFTGSLNGGRHTAIKTFNGMNGSIATSSANMSVSATISSGN